MFLPPRLLAGYNGGMNTHHQPVLPQPVRKLGGKALQQVLNRALALDPEAEGRLRKLDGRSVTVHLDGPDLAMRVHVDDGRLVVGPPQEESSLEVHTTPGVVLAILLDSRHEVGPGKVRMAGDAGLARELESLLHGWEPDLEAAFSEHIGDVAGVPLARFAERAWQAGKQAARQLREDAAAWARDEVELTPSHAEVDAWLDGVDAVRERSERLEDRLRRLERGQ